MSCTIMITKRCLVCNKEFFRKNYLVNKAKYCSSVCYHKAGVGIAPWNKGLHGYREVIFTGKTIKCKVCGKDKYFEPNQLRKRPCIYCSIQCARRDPENESRGYQAIHSWIKRKYGKASVCNYCSRTDGAIDWANVSKEYKRDITDWLMLCRKHHIAYDKGRLNISNQTDCPTPIN